jgi:gamma-glutamyltranspeptidase/glutathione hydrolase
MRWELRCPACRQCAKPNCSISHPERPQIENGTSHLAVVDDAGEVVSMTTSVEAAFGAQIAAGGSCSTIAYGLFSSNRHRRKPVANAPAAGKRPMSAMSPSIIFAPDGQFFAAVGSPGGAQIIGYVAQAIVNLIDAKLSMPDVAAAPRHVNLNGATLDASAARCWKAWRPPFPPWGPPGARCPLRFGRQRHSQGAGRL